MPNAGRKNNSPTDNFLRVVYDTGIVLQGTLHPFGPSGRALRLLDRDELRGFISGRVREEYVNVLSRPSVRRKNPNLTPEQSEAVLEWLDERMTLESILPAL